MGTLTPVEEHGGVLVKRDDLYRLPGGSGGKARTCRTLIAEAVEAGRPGVVTAGSRHSPQVNLVAGIAGSLGIAARAHVPDGPSTPELAAAELAGAEIVRHRPGYNAVIVARAREDAAASGWSLVPFGMECDAAVEATAGQVESLAGLTFDRVVVAVGSGMSAAGILAGLERRGIDVPILGVVVGADPTRRLDRYAPPFWRETLTLVPAGIDYRRPAPTTVLGDVELDPIYEAKTLPHLRAGDLLWVVGIRETSEPSSR